MIFISTCIISTNECHYCKHSFVLRDLYYLCTVPSEPLQCTYWASLPSEKDRVAPNKAVKQTCIVTVQVCCTVNLLFTTACIVHISPLHLESCSTAQTPVKGSAWQGHCRTGDSAGRQRQTSDTQRTGRARIASREGQQGSEETNIMEWQLSSCLSF